MEQILRQLKETVQTLLKAPPKNPSLAADVQILLQLGLQGLIPQGNKRIVDQVVTDKDFSHPSPQGFLKCNIDWASKGNPSLAGYGGVIRDEKGCILYIFHCNLGRATNNMEELMALEQCLEILKNDKLQNIIIEADSELIINSVKQIYYGSAPEKVLRHWRLLQVYQRIHAHLQNTRTLRFGHVWRTTNKLVDILANKGFLYSKRSNKYRWYEVP